MKLLRLDRAKLKDLIRSGIHTPLAGYARAPGPEGKDCFLAAMRALCEREPETDAQ
jgi:hypothetical protein